MYRVTKNNLKFENYLNHLNFKIVKLLCKFRGGNHYLPIDLFIQMGNTRTILKPARRSVLLWTPGVLCLIWANRLIMVHNTKGVRKS